MNSENIQNRPCVAHVLRVDSAAYAPFMVDSICPLKRFQSIIFTYYDGYQPAFNGVPIYAPYWSRHSWGYIFSNRVTKKIVGIPWLFAWATMRHRVKILHAHLGTHAIDFIPLVQRFKMPMVVSFYGYDASSAARHRPAYRKSLIMLFEKASLILALSEDMKKDLIHLDCPDDKIVIHRFGADIDKFKPAIDKVTNKILRILCVSTFEERKGLTYLIKAFRNVKNKFPSAELFHIGKPRADDGPRKKQLEKLIAELGLTECVNIMGYVPHSRLPSEYQAADLFVLPCVTGSDGDKEGTPTVLMEAQATGLPVVSTFHAGIPELVLNGITGYLVPERNVDALVDKICSLLANPHIRERMGTAGRQHMEMEFNNALQIEKIERIYDGLMTRMLPVSPTQWAGSFTGKKIIRNHQK